MLRLFCNCCVASNCKSKHSKYEFLCIYSLCFLAHIVSGKGASPDPDKVTFIARQVAHTEVHILRSISWLAVIIKIDLFLTLCTNERTC